MKQRLADYIADFFVAHGITECFTVVGGGAMYLNDAFGHHPDINCIYNHHEQASAMAAEAYARVTNKPALVCVTTGPGGTNALTGVCGAYVSSIPMLVVSGQVRTATSVYNSNLNLRSKGIQEFDIVECARKMTKYCATIYDPLEIRYHLEKAFFEALNGRKCPVWLDVPLDIQSSIIETSNLKGFDMEEPIMEIDISVIDSMIMKIKEASRPVIIVGNGVRLADAHKDFLDMIELLQVPVVVTTGSVDALWHDHPLYAGITGTTGSRSGNFVVQNADLIFSIGSRLSYSVTGFDLASWGVDAYKIVCDIDENELKKDSCKANMSICADAKSLIKSINERLSNGLSPKIDWLKKCAEWKEKYPVVLPKHLEDSKPNIYSFFNLLSEKTTSNNIIHVSCGQSRIVGSHAIKLKKDVRFITNSNFASMGFDLPAIIGINRANPKKKIVSVTGEGSIQMNLQELQTIIFHKIPVAIFIMNNQGYHSIRITQNSFFNTNHIGIGLESNDLSFPDFEKISCAYGYKFLRVYKNEDISKAVDWALAQSEPCICELILSKEQEAEPKVASRQLENGKIISAKLECMKPFLSDEEQESNMIKFC